MGFHVFVMHVWKEGYDVSFCALTVFMPSDALSRTLFSLNHYYCEDFDREANLPSCFFHLLHVAVFSHVWKEEAVKSSHLCSPKLDVFLPANFIDADLNHFFERIKLMNEADFFYQLQHKERPHHHHQRWPSWCVYFTIWSIEPDMRHTTLNDWKKESGRAPSLRISWSIVSIWTRGFKFWSLALTADARWRARERVKRFFE